MSNNDFEDFEEVQKKDLKNARGFYAFFLVWIILSIIWLANGGAEDGAWWMFGIGCVLLVLVNPIGNWLASRE